MDDYAYTIRRVIKFTLYFISLSLLAYALTEFKLQSAGLALGAVASLINSIHAARKINRLGDVAISQENKRVSLGAGTRIAIAALAAIIALRFPAYFDFYFTIAGIFVAQAIAFIDGIYQMIKTTYGRMGKG